jgi:hypothetical protein
VNRAAARFENDDAIMTVGGYRPLDDALRIAFTELVSFGIACASGPPINHRALAIQLADGINVSNELVAVSRARR